ncbi:MAG: DUF1667 domain-containing protein [Clostridiales bacterium]|nr:DUF1667 domain-containing protein [Clostridiales bacterium]
MKSREMICIVCPVGCHLTVHEDTTAESGYRVEGNQCPRGAVYGVKEVTNPTRVVTSTVKIKNGLLPRLPVKTDGDIPKELIDECMKVINSVEVEAPIKVGDVIISNVLDTGVDIIASRSM